ncbi:MAG: J domain-containing protein [Hydrococcus sp. RU_2_2]|jgi:DnaJ domain|nr:J domain-containing protein [Hydrococcus sp. RU_2_2]
MGIFKKLIELNFVKIFSQESKVENLVTQERTTNQFTDLRLPKSTRLANSYYAILGLHPSASAIEIRRAYRELSKRYHPDTTELPAPMATDKFRQLNEAYATLSSPERRSLYDLKIGYSRWNVIQAPSDLNNPTSQSRQKESNSAYLDPTDRPLSAGEIFALFILGLTLVGCLLLVIVIGLIRGESSQTLPLPNARLSAQESVFYSGIDKHSSEIFEL